MTQKLDIFKILGQLNKKDRDFYNRLTDDEKKQVLPYLLMRWMSGCSDQAQIFILNEVVNPYVFALHRHKPLISYLLTVPTDGKFKKYKWVKNTANVGNMPLSQAVIAEYFGYNSRDSKDALKLLSDDAIIRHAEELGRQPDEIAKIKKELKART